MAGQWYFCVKHHRVEPEDGCKEADRLGPYATESDAAQALQTVARRNAEWEAEDERWEGERG